jgi:hypothetical protein
MAKRLLNCSTALLLAACLAHPVADAETQPAAAVAEATAAALPLRCWGEV